jgi:hypothetical protein
MLRAEGLEPRRLGKASPALLGAGDWAIEQLIEVPRQHEPAARALIAASRPGEDAQSNDLDVQALSAGPAPAIGAGRPERGFSGLIIGLIVALAALLFFVLR